MKTLLKTLFNVILVLIISNCQINQSINEIMEKFEVTKDNSAKETKKNQNNETKDVLEKNSSIQQEKLTENLKKKNVLEEKQNEELALVQPKIKVEDLENFSKKENIGLLFPLTGADSKIGTSLVNTIRMKISKDNINHTFKVYDTKSSKTGLINAFNNGYYDGVRHFIGPIFSSEAIALKNITESKNVKIFSLSNDKNAVSENIIITGYSIEDELRCLFDNMQLDKNSSIGIIISDSQYGKLIKETTIQFLSSFPNVKLEFLELFNEDIDLKIKEFSFYNKRRKLLENEMSRVENEELEEKDIVLKRLSKLNTFGELPYDYLVVGESGNRLIEILSLLSFYDINSSNTKIYGTSIWQGLEKFDEDVLENTYFVTSLKENSKIASDAYSRIRYTEFSRLKFLADDLVGIVTDIIYDNKKIKKLKESPFIADYSNIMLTNEGLFKREIFLKEFKYGTSKIVSKCPF
tara:strand:+ start:3604 stop:4998 length:1395 start_codon:yes stop_codon:yes gene_type:complete